MERGDAGTRSMETFGDWLATRTNNYLSAYDRQSEVPQEPVKRGKTNQTMTKAKFQGQKKEGL